MKEKIRNFWMNKKHLALFGFSRNNKSISRQVYDLLVKKKYNIYPINPNTEKIDSIVCYKSLDDIKQKLDGAIIITNPKISAGVVKKCRERELNDLWFQLDTMDEKVKAYCDNNDINYIKSCVLLHHEEVGFPHNLHRFFYTLFGGAIARL